MSMKRTFTCTVHTSVKAKIVEKELPRVRELLLQARGLEDIVFTVKQFDPSILATYTRSQSQTGTNWEWFKKNITTQTSDMEVVHLTPEQLQQCGLVHPSGALLGGEYNVDKDDTMDCMVGVPLGTPSAYPLLTEFQRVMVHEFCHGFSHWTTNDPMGVVHQYDDPLTNKKNLLMLPALYDFTLHTLLTTIRNKLKELVKLKTPNRLYQAARRVLNTDASPRDRAHDEVGCAETVTEIIKSVLPTFPIILGTATLLEHLKKDTRFVQVSTPQAGDIILSPTGSSSSTIVRNGHVGICGEGNEIMSNTSADGIFRANYTQETWDKRWTQNGYTKYYFRLK
jgi:hypothetical protein